MADHGIAICVFITLSTILAGSLGSVVDASFQTELLNRMNALEKQGQQQAEKVQAMQSSLEEQDNRLAVQDRTILDYKKRVADLERIVTELKLNQDSTVPKSIVESNAESKPNHRIVRSNESVQSGFKHGSTTSVMQGRAHRNADGKVAFQAVIEGAAKLHLGPDQKIVFPIVKANLGQGYNSLHGIFTAPQAGIYIFSTSILSDSRDHVEIMVDLMKSGQLLARAYAHGDSGRHDQGSVTVVTPMEAGEDVWVSVNGPPNTSLFGGDFDNFMGCLIYPF